jgi:hypothetical protein
MTVPPTDDRFPTEPAHEPRQKALDGFKRDSLVTPEAAPVEVFTAADLNRTYATGAPPQRVPIQKITYVEDDSDESQPNTVLWGLLDFLCGFLCAGTMVYLVLR